MANSPFSRGSDNHKPIYGGGDYYKWTNHIVGGTYDAGPHAQAQIDDIKNSKYNPYYTPDNPHGTYTVDTHAQDIIGKRGMGPNNPPKEQGGGGVRVPRNPLPMRPSGGMSLPIPR